MALGEKMLEEWSIQRCVIGAKNNGFQSTFSESRLLFCTARPGSQRSSIFLSNPELDSFQLQQASFVTSLAVTSLSALGVSDLFSHAVNVL